MQRIMGQGHEITRPASSTMHMATCLSFHTKCPQAHLPQREACETFGTSVGETSPQGGGGCYSTQSWASTVKLLEEAVASIFIVALTEGAVTLHSQSFRSGV